MYNIQIGIKNLSQLLTKVQDKLKELLDNKCIVYPLNASFRQLVKLIPDNFKIILPIQLSIPRIGHTAVLVNENILFSGSKNNLTSQQLYSINSNSFTAKANLNPGKYEHAGCNVNNNVLLNGGYPNGGAIQQLYNIISDSFTTKANLSGTTYNHTCITIDDNSVLICGGFPNLQTSQKLYNINSDSFIIKANINPGRIVHSSVLINSNSVLISFGNGTNTQNTQQIYNMETNIFINKVNSSVSRMSHTGVYTKGSVL